jgi:hypothetical protein
MKHPGKWTALAVVMTATLMGCETHKPAPPVRMAPAFSVPDNRSAATAALTERTAAFNDAVGDMPGATGGDHREALTAALDELSKILRLANGPVESPEFANRILVIDSAAKTTANPTIPRTRMEALENEALTAASKALAELTSRYLYDDDQLPPMLDALNTACGTALSTNGPGHDLDATEAFRDVATVVQRINDDMVERFGTSPATDATAPPAAPPASAPTSAPATEPATAPAAAPMQ